jgi:hypothetical protein
MNDKCPRCRQPVNDETIVCVCGCRVREKRLQDRVDVLLGAIAGWQVENARLASEVERLRALCAARPNSDHIPLDNGPFDAWVEKIDAAGREAGNPLLTHDEIRECIAASDSDYCQACGLPWTAHRKRCAAERGEGPR